MLYLIITPICFFVDQICKMKAVKNMDDYTNKPILNNNIILRLSYNEGAFLGLLKNNKVLLLIINIVSIIILLGLSISYTMVKGNYIIKIGLAFITGGALSNIADRVRLKKVVDYFAFKIKPNLIFNLADMFVFLGCLIIVISEVISDFS
ncbi:MAG: signal peptidase II [Vallitalea sp.]|nr:signal peptidase II [Vallitalea sp.]